MVITCKQCGAQNRIGEIPRGRVAVCGKCRHVLGQVENSPRKEKSSRISGATWAWIAIIGIGLLAWIVDASRSSHSTRSKDSRSSGDGSYSYSSDDYRSPSRPDRPPFTETEQPLPNHGKITWYSAGDPVAPLEIKSSLGSHYLVKLSDYNSGKDVLSVFVHGGSTATFDVPLGTYRIKYASGERWYGPEHLFGPETAYSKADSSFDFQVIGNHVSGYTLTLYKVLNGNLQTSKISPEEF